MIRLGLCCQFLEEPIRFRTTTARYLGRLIRSEQLQKLSRLCLSNSQALFQAIEFCHRNHIGCFRVNSRILPLKTHPQLAYSMDILPDAREIRNTFLECGKKAAQSGVRLTFHPDQFILLSSPDEEIVRNSIRELEYQAEVSDWIGADVINLHGGGGYGDKRSALERMGKSIAKLNREIRRRLTLENDDRVYTPSDLLPFCRKHRLPFVYDVHHHRCHPDRLTVPEATRMALETWNREPLFHISSPREGWGSSRPRYHRDDIDIRDFPDCWMDLAVTIEVEAKAKERAVIRLQRALEKKLGKNSEVKKRPDSSSA